MSTVNNEYIRVVLLIGVIVNTQINVAKDNFENNNNIFKIIVSIRFIALRPNTCVFNIIIWTTIIHERLNGKLFYKYFEREMDIMFS